MNQNKIDSLYELIKQKSQEKGHPLKIIADGDECLQPGRPAVLYAASPKSMPFKDYFKRFGNNVAIVYKNAAGGYINNTLGLDKEKLCCYSYVDKADEKEIENGENYKKLKYGEKQGLSFDKSENPYDDKPGLSLAQELLLAYKEGFIKEIMLLTAFSKGRHPSTGNPHKISKASRSGNYLPNVYLKQIECAYNPELGVVLPYRGQWLKEKGYTDFDMFIDDNPHVIKETLENFPEMCYVMPDYRCTRDLQASNIYHVKQEVSDLKDEDFVKAAEEYKEKTKTNNNKGIDAKSILLGSGLTVLVLCGLGLFYVLQKRIKKKRQ